MVWVGARVGLSWRKLEFGWGGSAAGRAATGETSPTRPIQESQSPIVALGPWGPAHDGQTARCLERERPRRSRHRHRPRHHPPAIPGDADADGHHRGSGPDGAGLARAGRRPAKGEDHVQLTAQSRIPVRRSPRPRRDRRWAPRSAPRRPGRDHRCGQGRPHRRALGQGSQITPDQPRDRPRDRPLSCPPRRPLPKPRTTPRR